ncbi:MAG TPA: alanine--tRNA ligase [Candidatus Moranbacteria bacterium]|nr:alanine--tRNA ligase [Candidatus Moranbacteria bacterium]
MTASELRQKYLEFFEKHGHAIIPSASLIPENDPTVLFTTAGMHPLVPYLSGEKHPQGKRLANCQKCIRTGDIDEVGDATHHTFFEMLGNWSLGDYFKKEAIEWSYEFLTSPEWLGLDKNRIAVSVFAGDKDAPFDSEAYEIWKSLGVSEKRIAKLPKKNNWWGPAGETGPCGPDSEIFYWVGDPENVPESFNDDNDLWVEIWNDVFMEYGKKKDGTYEKLEQKNVDTGMGLVRVLVAINGLDDNYKTELFWPIIQKIEELSGKKYEDNKKEFRIIADHIIASVFIIADGITPSNVQRGYVLRRLIRRAIRQGHLIGIKENFINEIAKVVQEIYEDIYPEILKENILGVLEKEEDKFNELLSDNKVLKLKNKEVERYKLFLLASMMEKGISSDKVDEFMNKKILAEGTPITATAFNLESTHGYPHDMFFLELFKGVGLSKSTSDSLGKKLEKDFIERDFKQHQELSRTASAGMFKGGLADAGEISVKYHTATHLLLAAIREILGQEIYQKGSNINAERLRFDFNYPEKLTPEQIKKIEDLVNQKIQENIPVEMIEMKKDEALKIAKISFDPAKYGEIVKVYKIGDFSIELCGGPHVKNTSEIGKFKITKEESSSAGVRRIKAVLG